MTLEIKKTNEIEKVGRTALIYADSGVGKTRLLGTIPGRTLILDVEGGTIVLKDKEIDMVRIHEDLGNLADIFEELQISDLPYDNVCLDSATELEKFMLINLARASKNDGIPGLREYGICQFKMREYFRALRDLREKNINVIVTALEMPLELEHNDGIIRTRAYPMLARKLAPELCGLFDIVGHLEISAKKETVGQRYIRLEPTENIVAKDRLFGRRYCGTDAAELFGLKKENNKKEVGK